MVFADPQPKLHKHMKAHFVMLNILASTQGWIMHIHINISIYPLLVMASFMSIKIQIWESTPQGIDA